MKDPPNPPSNATSIGERVRERRLGANGPSSKSSSNTVEDDSVAQRVVASRRASRKEGTPKFGSVSLKETIKRVVTASSKNRIKSRAVSASSKKRIKSVASTSSTKATERRPLATRLRGVRYRTATRLAHMCARRRSLGSPVNLDSRLARGSVAHVRDPRPVPEAGRAVNQAPLDDDIEEVDDTTPPSLAAIIHPAEPNAVDDDAEVGRVQGDSPVVGEGAGGEVFDSFASAFHAAAEDGANYEDAHAMGSAVVGLPGPPDNAAEGNDQPVMHTPRRSPRLRALREAMNPPESADSAPFGRSILTPNGRHFDRDAMDEWSNWRENGRYCNGLPPYF